LGLAPVKGKTVKRCSTQCGRDVEENALRVGITPVITQLLLRTVFSNWTA
jgi:hypothetical protein